MLILFLKSNLRLLYTLFLFLSQLTSTCFCLPLIFFLSLSLYSGEATYKSTPKEVDKEYIYLEGLDPNYNYEVRVVSVDGEHQTPSRVKPISLSDEVPCKINCRNYSKRK